MAVGVFAFLLAMPVTPETVTVTNSDFGSVDGTTLTRAFVVSGASTITDVDILIDFSKCGSPAPGPADTRCLSQDFSGNDQIVFQLISPLGTPVDLVTAGTYDIEATGARVSVTFDDGVQDQVGPSLQVLVGLSPPDAIHFSAAGDVNADGSIDNRDYKFDSGHCTWENPAPTKSKLY